MTTSEATVAIRTALKAEGWGPREVSVRKETYSLGSSIHVTVKRADIPLPTVQSIANAHAVVRYCEATGDVLGGGNRYVHVGYSREAQDIIRARYAAVLTATARGLQADANDNSLHPIGDTGYLLGKGSNGYGYTLWSRGEQGRYLTSANEVEYLAAEIHTGRI